MKKRRHQQDSDCYLNRSEELVCIMKYTGYKWDKSRRGNVKPKLSLTTGKQVSEKELDNRMARGTRAG